MKLKIKLSSYIQLFFILLSVLIGIVFIFIYENYRQILIDNFQNKHTNQTQQIREDYRLLLDKLQYDFKSKEEENIKKIDELYQYYKENKNNFDMQKAEQYLNRDINFGKYQIFFINKKNIIEDSSYKQDIGYDLGEYKALRDLFDSLYKKQINIDVSAITLNTFDFKRYLLKLSHDEEYILQIGFVLNIYDDIKTKHNKHTKYTNLLDIYLANEIHIQKISFDEEKLSKDKKDLKQGWVLTKNLLSELYSYANLKDIEKQKVLNLLNTSVEMESIKINEHIDKLFEHDDLIVNMDLANNNLIAYSITDGLFSKTSETKLIIKTVYYADELKNDIKNVQNYMIISFIFVLLLLFLIYLFIEKSVSSKLSELINHIQNNENSTLENINIQEINFLHNNYNDLREKLLNEIELNSNLLKENKRFIADTVHQIRTPLTNIMMNGEMVKKFQKDDSLSSFIDKIDASINMLSNSYEDLSYITTSDTIEYPATKVNISSMLKNRIKFFSTISKVNKKEIISNIEDDVFIYINQIELERIIDNNISNGIKYATKDELITINLFKNTDFIILEFKTFGNPIQNKNRVFDKNYRESEAKRGLGLGLNMVKNICDKYEITYSVTYKDNQNIFTYYFK